MPSRRLLTLGPSDGSPWVMLYVPSVGDRWAAMIVANEETPPELGQLKGLGCLGDTAEEA